MEGHGGSVIYFLGMVWLTVYLIVILASARVMMDIDLNASGFIIFYPIVMFVGAYVFFQIKKAKRHGG